jgi:hypothetical protein
MGLNAALLPPPPKPGVAGASIINETNRMHLVLSGMHYRTLRPYLTAIDRILISVVHAST